MPTAILAYAPVLHALGVTGAHDPGELLDDPDAAAGPWLFAAMAADGRLPLRVAGSIREGQLSRAIDWGLRSGRRVGRYRDGWLKLFADGSLGSRSAALLEPYEADDPGGPPVGGSRGMLLQSAEALRALATRAAGANIAVQIHGIGDAAVRAALDTLAGLPGIPTASGIASSMRSWSIRTTWPLRGARRRGFGPALPSPERRAGTASRLGRASGMDVPAPRRSTGPAQ